MARKIVLFSDGTGNSSSKVWRTNVWRTFQALDLTGSDQVAIYDDGVGTSSFKPLAILGGVFGYGLRRNVLNLYKFASRTYKFKQDHLDDIALGRRQLLPGEIVADDEIFGFGFSRGAFTIRVVAGFILHQGLVSADSEEELDRRARIAYRAFRASRPSTTPLAYLYYAVAHDLPAFVRKLFRRTPKNLGARQVKSIRFLGLWDTVAAYGLPVDEMTRGFSKFIWPLELPKRQLDPRVLRACHALSLDDERTTFHPILWDESLEVRKPFVDDDQATAADRISQVWFAGVHANVGGGYPDDSLAHVSLNWILQEAAACDLRFKTPPAADPDALKNLGSAQDKDGRLYDSRSGLGGYYRYGPRKVSELIDTRKTAPASELVYIKVPKIHESVFSRMKIAAHYYAPIGLPGAYEIVTYGCKLEPMAPSPYEDVALAPARHAVQERDIWNLVWRRRAVYFLTVLATGYMLLYPVYSRFPTDDELKTPIRFLSDAIKVVSNFFPSFLARWSNAYQREPLEFLIWLSLVAILIWIGARLKSQIADRMGMLWKSSLRLITHPPRYITPAPTIGGWLARYGSRLILLLLALSPILRRPNNNGLVSVPEAYEHLIATGSGLVTKIVTWLEHVLNILWSGLGDRFSDLAGIVDFAVGQFSLGYAPIYAGLLLVILMLHPAIVYGVRTARLYQWCLRALKVWVAPFLFAVVFVGLAFVGPSHLLFNLRDSAGSFCPLTEFKEVPKCSKVDMRACVKATALDPPDKSALAACSNKCPAETLYVDTGALCTASHFKLEKNHTYQFQLSKASTDEITAEADRIEKDGTAKEKNAGAFILEAAKKGMRSNAWTFGAENWPFGRNDAMEFISSPRGLPDKLTWGQAVYATLLWPFKRSLDRPLGHVIVRYGSTGNEETFIDPDPGQQESLDEVLKPGVDGEVYIYVNKPVLGLWSFENIFPSSGIAKVKLSRIEK